MKTSFIVCFALIALAQSINIRKQDSSRLNVIKNLEKIGEQSQISQNIVSNLQLSLQTGGKVDDVIQLVKDTLTNVQTQRANLYKEYQAEMFRLQENIDNLNKELDQLNEQLTNEVALIGILTQQINSLNLRITALQAEIDSLATREQLLSEARENDIQAFEARQIRDKNAIAALEEIIPSLENLISNGGGVFLEKTQEEIVKILKRIPVGKPLQQFVELSTQFTEAQLRTVIEKLSAIYEAIVAGKKEDESSEIASKVRFESILSEIQIMRTTAYQKLNNAKNEVANKEMAKKISEDNRDRLIDNISSTTTIRDNSIKVKEDSEAQYQRRLTDADSAINSLNQVLEILTENQSDLQNQEAVVAQF